MVLHKKVLTHKAFTLSELLIALAVLGVISALTIPSVYNSVQTNKRTAVLKESFSSFATVIKKAADEDALNTNARTEVALYVLKNMDVVAHCASSYTAASDFNCPPEAKAGPSGSWWSLDWDKFMLKNGSWFFVTDDGGSYGPFGVVLFDYNGPVTDKPGDTFMVAYNALATQHGGGDGAGGSNIVEAMQPGQIRAMSTGGGNVADYANVFK